MPTVRRDPQTGKLTATLDGPAPCRWEGPVTQGCDSCDPAAKAARSVRICLNDAAEWGRCTRGPNSGADPDVGSCGACPHHSRRTYAAPVYPARPPAPSGPVAVGVAIGSYKWPELVALQLSLIRATCGPVPVLVSGDRPEDVPALAGICGADPDCYLWPNAERIGHTGGDLACYWKGVIWGAARGLRVVAKLSQRFLVERPNWLADGAAELLVSGLPLASRRCRGVQSWPLRTEAALLDVAAWHRPEVLSRIAPRRYWADSPRGMAAETVVHRLLQDLLGGVYWPWSLFGEERHTRNEGVVWHNSHTAAEYRALAARHGVELPADFTAAGWGAEARAGEYLHG